MAGDKKVKRARGEIDKYEQSELPNTSINTLFERNESGGNEKSICQLMTHLD